jgi:hypothetical protein
MNEFVYFFQVGDYGPIKVGHTERDVETRFKELQRGIPFPLKFLGKQRADKTRETFWKEYFSENMIVPNKGMMKNSLRRTEWFEPTEEMLDMIYNTTESSMS